MKDLFEIEFKVTTTVRSAQLPGALVNPLAKVLKNVAPSIEAAIKLAVNEYINENTAPTQGEKEVK